MTKTVEIIDRGRGPQLSTSRITVQDLVPYLTREWTYEQILEIMPVLTVADIQAVERYIQENHEAVMEQDRRISERNATRRRSPEVEEIEHQARLQRLERARQDIREKRQERKGDQASG